jgi:hypothetical protein
MEKKKTGQMDLKFDERGVTPTFPESNVTSLTARIEATRSAEKKELYRAILSRAAHLLRIDRNEPPDHVG